MSGALPSGEAGLTSSRFKSFRTQIVCGQPSQAALSTRAGSLKAEKTRWISKTTRHTCQIERILALYLLKPGGENCRPGHVELKLG